MGGITCTCRKEQARSTPQHGRRLFCVSLIPLGLIAQNVPFREVLTLLWCLGLDVFRQAFWPKDQWFDDTKQSDLPTLLFFFWRAALFLTPTLYPTLYYRLFPLER